MKKFNTLLITFVLIVTLLISCKKENKSVITSEIKTYDQLTKANWLIGEWENIKGESAFYENWIKKTDSSFIGKSYVLAGKDTVFNENVILEQQNDSLFYIVSIENQNEEKPVSFYLSSASSNQLVFENPKHDFPTKIVYNKINNDSIFAEISGKQEGKEVKESFPMKKNK
jgi:hypothetical protein